MTLTFPNFEESWEGLLFPAWSRVRWRGLHSSQSIRCPFSEVEREVLRKHSSLNSFLMSRIGRLVFY